MSQMPPPGTPYPPQGYGQGYALPAAPMRTSAAAVCALIFGIVGFCVPAIGGLIGFILGCVGISATGNPSVRGRGMAVTGLILSILSMLLWVGGGLAFWSAVSVNSGLRTQGEQFVTYLSNGNTDAAQAMCDSSVSSAEIAALAKQVQAWGAPDTYKVWSIEAKSHNNGFAGMVSGTVDFKNGSQHQLTLQYRRVGNDLKINQIILK